MGLQKAPHLLMHITNVAQKWLLSRLGVQLQRGAIASGSKPTDRTTRIVANQGVVQRGSHASTRWVCLHEFTILQALDAGTRQDGHPSAHHLLDHEKVWGCAGKSSLQCAERLWLFVMYQQAVATTPTQRLLRSHARLHALYVHAMACVACCALSICGCCISMTCPGPA